MWYKNALDEDVSEKNIYIYTPSRHYRPFSYKHCCEWASYMQEIFFFICQLLFFLKICCTWIYSIHFYSEHQACFYTAVFRSICFWCAFYVGVNIQCLMTLKSEAMFVLRKISGSKITLLPWNEVCVSSSNITLS